MEATRAHNDSAEVWVLHRGFTLVEMAIVLVIIGLIVGGVFIGRSLLDTAKLHSLASEIQRYETTWNTFIAKYEYTPGDYPKGYLNWAGMSGCTVNNNSTMNLTNNRLGCNGDGNGILDDPYDVDPTKTVHSEGLKSWVHLANAGMIEGQFVGYTGSSPYMQANINLPMLRKWDGVTLFPVYHPSDGLIPRQGNVLVIGKVRPSTNANFDPFLMPIEAEAVDKKIDDGKPYTGRLESYPMGTNRCGGSPPTASFSYSITDMSVVCSFYYFLDNR